MARYTMSYVENGGQKPNLERVTKILFNNLLLFSQNKCSKIGNCYM